MNEDPETLAAVGHMYLQIARLLKRAEAAEADVENLRKELAEVRAHIKAWKPFTDERIRRGPSNP